jgi:hypothetical protein
VECRVCRVYAVKSKEENKIIINTSISDGVRYTIKNPNPSNPTFNPIPIYRGSERKVKMRVEGHYIYKIKQ